MSFSEALALVILKWWLIATVASQRIDQIEVAEQRGSKVVEATVQYIRQSMIFPDDQNFLRRIAFVESKDGDDPNTYRAGYHGGIWQVDRIGFQDTQNVAAHPELTSKFDAIRQALKIDWPSVTWSDLRKPLYSAIAARLFLSNIPEAIPPSANVNDQARYWKQYYNTPAGAGTEQKFIADVAALPQSCSVAGVDIAFVMDGSGSISSSDFQRSKKFVKRVAGTNIIGLTATRVGVIQYNSNPRTEFDFISHTTSPSLQQAIDGISYRGGGTYTGRAITSMINLFDNGGARPTSENIPRIGIVITDGRSSDDVLSPANDARSKGITMFAIGVGAAVESELNEIANDPDSSFRYRVENFSIIGNIQGLISSETCRVPAKVDINTGFQEMLQPDTVRFISYTIPASRMVTIKISSRIGQIIGYFSYRIRNPSAALYDWKLETTATRRFVQLFIDFSSVIGRRRKRQLIGADNAMTLYGTIENKGTVSADTNIITEDGDTRLPTTPVPNLSPCDPSTPCANGGSCLPNQAILGTYYCQCSGCFAGDRCGIDMACINNACQNEGQCISFADSCDRYYCSCPPCFYGQFCENRIDVCSNHNCQNGAMCVNPLGTCRDYQCACSGCYTGAFCEIALPNPCNDVVPLCQNSGTCAPIPGYCFAYHCQCNNGYSGRNCEIAPVTNFNICNDFPCSNGGTCVSQHDVSYDCVCRPGWTGPGCRRSTSIQGSSSVCMPFLCDNGGTCYDSNTFGDLSPNQYSCICALGWAGIGCSIPTDIAAPPRRCNTNPYICQNGGVCNYAYISLSQMSIPFCVCPVGYIGQRCETQYFNPCDSNPCRNNAVCSAFNTYFVCQCFSGFSGITCNENDDNPCSRSPCQNGNCYQSVSGEYFCACFTGFSGINCGTREPDDPCSSSPCQNGNCYQALSGVSGGEYFCDCSTGFSGMNCERDISPPIISGCPNNINRMIQIQPGQSTATVAVSWNEPTASDSSGIKSVDAIYPGTTMLTLSSGASTKVEYVFTDNFDNKAKCSFAVSVSASNGPVVIGCNLQNMQVILPSGQTSLSVSWNEPISSGIRPSFQSYRPGDSFQMGTYAVRYRFGTVPSVTVCSFILDVVDVQTVGRSKRDSFLQNDHVDDEIPNHLSGTRFIYPLIVFSLACVFVVVGTIVIVPKLRNLKKNGNQTTASKAANQNQVLIVS